MTLVLSVHSRDSLWLVVDRRLSYGGRRPPVDDAVKVMNLETTDGVGLLAYAGLGATSQRTQPSDWMSAVLRGRGGLTFVQALEILSAVANKELPRHLSRLPGGAHFIIVAAFVRDVGPRVYTIDNALDRKTGKHLYRFTKRLRTALPGSPSVRFALGGTGGLYLAQKRGAWQRDLLRLVNAHDRGKISDLPIADRLASLNFAAHQQVRDDTVGPRCIVVWRRRPDARRAASGGGHQFYTGVDREPIVDASIPTIWNGVDVQALVGVFMKQIESRVAVHGFSEAGLDFDPGELNRHLARLPDQADEKLR